jgi:sn-glycerol 3-phosphate transport system substrate-binding protein
MKTHRKGGMAAWTRRVVGAAATVAGLAMSTQALAVTEIQWWHAMTGALNDKVNNFAERFNKSQSDYRCSRWAPRR